MLLGQNFDNQLSVPFIQYRITGQEYKYSQSAHIPECLTSLQYI